MPTSISKYRPSISKLHIVPDIEAKTLTFDIEGLVFDIVHISISGILLRYRSLARFQMEWFTGNLNSELLVPVTVIGLASESEVSMSMLRRCNLPISAVHMNRAL